MRGKKSFSANISHTLSSLLNALNSFTWTFCIVSSLAHIMTGSKHACTHHSHTHTLTHNNGGGSIHLLGLSLTCVHIVCMVLCTVLTHRETQYSLKLPAI